MLEIKNQFAGRMEDARRWLIASVLTLAAGSLALQAASGPPVADVRVVAMLSFGLLSLSLLLGVSAVLSQFACMTMRVKQFDHAAEAGWHRFVAEGKFKANDNAPPNKKKETADVAKEQVQEADRQSDCARSASEKAKRYESYVAPLAIFQAITWLIGFACLLFVLLWVDLSLTFGETNSTRS